MTDLHRALDESAAAVNQMLADALPLCDADFSVLHDAMQYSLLAGGKRVRPFLTLSVCKMFGGDQTVAMRFACGIEMIHTYSLIHDDLPCMDNDDLRRGLPTCHRAFGESIALLAGDALLTHAFKQFSDQSIPAEQSRAAVQLAAGAAGALGMIGGQVMDLEGTKGNTDLAKLRRLQQLKTGALLCLSAQLGCISAGITDIKDKRFDAVTHYAAHIGAAFQITDDILDAYGTAEQLGKPIGSDTENGKITFLSFLTQEEAYAAAKAETNAAILDIAPYDRADLLTLFAKYLLQRDR